MSAVEERSETISLYPPLKQKEHHCGAFFVLNLT
jgi:hypothetical protein